VDKVLWEGKMRIPTSPRFRNLVIFESEAQYYLVTNKLKTKEEINEELHGEGK
jgi:hypothetical protein